MVKVQKPNPKSIKEKKIRKPLIKTSSKNPIKENVKKSVGKTRVAAASKFVKDLKQISVLNKNSKTTQQTVEKTLPKKKLIVAAKLEKKKPIIAVEQEMIKSAAPKKKKAVATKFTGSNIEIVPKKTAFNMKVSAKCPLAGKFGKKNVLGAKVEKNKAVATNIKKKTPFVEKKTPFIKKNNSLEKQTKLVEKKTTFFEKKTPLVKKKTPLVEKKTPFAEKFGKKNKLPTKAKNKNQNAINKLETVLKKKNEQNFNEVAKRIPSPLYESADFNKEKFREIVSLENIKNITKALKALVEKEVSEKKTSIFSDYKYFLNVSSYKIPNCPKRMVKLNLKYSLVDTEMDDVVMIVPDLQRGAKFDYEPTIQHYEDLLRKIDVKNIKIMPFNQLRKEVGSYEAKRKFANTYDYFLCDGRIVGHVVGFCGKNFQKPRTTIHAVSLNNPITYKKEIERALKRTSYRQLQKGDLISIPVGNHRFDIKELAENMEEVIKQLETIFPGGYANIRNMHIKIDIEGTSSLPLYVSLSGAPAEVPNIVGPREQRMIKLKKAANDILCKFSMSKAGDFVKLNKTQAKRKEQIRHARTMVSSKENGEIDESIDELNSPLRKTSMKDRAESPSIIDDGGESADDTDNTDHNELSEED